MKTETKEVLKIFLRLKCEEIWRGIVSFFKFIGIGFGGAIAVFAVGALLSLIIGFIHLHLFNYVWRDADSKNIWIKYIQNGFQDWAFLLIGLFFSAIIIGMIHTAYKKFTGWISMNWWRANNEYARKTIPGMKEYTEGKIIKEREY